MDKPLPNVALLLDSNRGTFIPRDFVTGFDLSTWSGIKAGDAMILENPDHEWYWEAWQAILDRASYTAPDGRVFTLYQDGDLWALCIDCMTAEEKHNFSIDV